MKQANIQYEDVVIVGAGPVGLAAAAEFANHGIKSVVLELSKSCLLYTSDAADE